MEMEPLNIWRRVEEMQRQIKHIFEETLASFAPAVPFDLTPRFFPPADVYTTDEVTTVIFALPGVMPEDLDLSIEGNALTIRGRFELPVFGKPLLDELQKGDFIRRIELPSEPDEEVEPEAELSDGLLTVRIKHRKRGV